MKLVAKTHELSGMTIVEIHNERGEMVGTIYPTDVGIKIISPNFVPVEGHDDPMVGVTAYLSTEMPFPVPQFDIPFGEPGPYTFKGDKLVKIGRG